MVTGVMGTERNEIYCGVTANIRLHNRNTVPTYKE